MAKDFEVSIRKNSDSLLLNLSGDFDKNAASEVLEILEQNCSGISKVFINTNHLEHIDPFGLIEHEWSSWEQALNGA